ncbi:MAG: hypothetical protein IJS44_03100 [Clostridia bacterium]|nr:hypothetical protein [Clostridia bacterium]
MKVPNDRWNSPFPHTLAFELFRRHFTELNNIYWAHVPAANTIQRKAKDALQSESSDPKSFFLVPDADDRRIATTYSQWKSSYSDFLNYTRLNMVMLLSSSFETYLRTVISLSFESKPGTLIHCPEAVDGINLLWENAKYGEYGSNEYQFSDETDSICRGEWNSRIASYIKFFGSSPLQETELSELDDLRRTRNLVGHYFGRDKKVYEAPLLIQSSPAYRVSHEKLIKYLKVVYTVAEKIDSHLHRSFIGSYDILKYYFINFEKDGTVGDEARKLKKALGTLGLSPIGLNYYRNIISYTLRHSETDPCKYNRKASISIINDELVSRNISLRTNEKHIKFSGTHLSLFINAFQLKNDPDYCKFREKNGKTEHFYSQKTIEFIVGKIVETPNDIINDLYSIVNSRNQQ